MQKPIVPSHYDVEKYENFPCPQEVENEQLYQPNYENVVNKMSSACSEQNEKSVTKQ